MTSAEGKEIRESGLSNSPHCGVDDSTSDDTVASITNGRGKVSFNITDPYTAPPINGIIDRILRFLIQTYRFLNHPLSNGR